MHASETYLGLGIPVSEAMDETDAAVDSALRSFLCQKIVTGWTKTS
jgi:hypothetical protein